MKKPGELPMPPNFRYRDAYLQGRPQHDQNDSFRAKHPQMPLSKRAKIFAPFAALKGYDEAVEAKQALYTDRVSLSPEEQELLDRKLSALHVLTEDARKAAENQVRVQVTYFEPCSDPDSEAFGREGQYVTVNGVCLNVDTLVTQTIRVDDLRIPLEDVVQIEAEDIFPDEWGDC